MRVPSEKFGLMASGYRRYPPATVVGEPTRRDLQRPKSSHEFMPSCTVGLRMVTSVLISRPSSKRRWCSGFDQILPNFRDEDGAYR